MTISLAVISRRGELGLRGRRQDSGLKESIELCSFSLNDHCQQRNEAIQTKVFDTN